jgi:predicted ATPase
LRIEDFQLAPRPLNPDEIRLTWRHKNSGICLDAAALSDGTLRYVALATLFLQPPEYRPSVVTVDEPELGLHPHATAMLASLVKQSSRETRVILSTQSTWLLDHFEPEDVLVAHRVNAGTRLNRLDARELEEWLEDYSLGQLWEKNEIGGRPAA